MDKRFLGILVGLVIVFIGVFAISSHKNDSTNNSSSSSTGQATNHVQGQGKAGVTLVEYGDYECPVCEVYYHPLKAVANQYSNDIYFQFRNLPLSQIHQNAFAAARAAEAAGLQGKFWQMHDALYDNQTEWTPPVANPLPVFDKYAKNIGLNISQFNDDYASSKVNSAINADINAFMKTGQQQATPTFFLNGKYIANDQLVDSSGQPSADKISNLIKAEIAKKQQNK